MKKALFVILVSTFIFISCDDNGMEEETNPFIGTWELIDNVDSTHLEITKTNFTCSYLKDENRVIYWTGTYTYDNTKIIVTLDPELSAEGMIVAYGETGFIFNKYEFKDELLYLYSPIEWILRKLTS